VRSLANSSAPETESPPVNSFFEDAIEIRRETARAQTASRQFSSVVTVPQKSVERLTFIQTLVVVFFVSNVFE
jgi:hypothetical protein